ncbi:MAG: hypothetical protein AAF416_19280 [Pseudomonadota bacterium]
MSGAEEADAIASGLPDLLDTLSSEALNRRPDGRSAGRFLSAEHDGRLWLFPVNRRGRTVADLAAHPVAGDTILGGLLRHGVAYWLAHAIRQDLWRALAGRRGPLPVVAVALAAGASPRTVLAGALLPPRTRLPMGWQAGALDRSRLAQHAAWAKRRDALNRDRGGRGY